MRPDGFCAYLPDYRDGALIGMPTPEERAAWMGSLTFPMATGLRERRRAPLAVRAHNAVLAFGGTRWFEVTARLEVDLPPLAGPAVLELEVEPVAHGPALWPLVVQAQAFALDFEREQHTQPPAPVEPAPTKFRKQGRGQPAPSVSAYSSSTLYWPTRSFARRESGTPKNRSTIRW